MLTRSLFSVCMRKLLLLSVSVVLATRDTQARSQRTRVESRRAGRQAAAGEQRLPYAAALDPAADHLGASVELGGECLAGNKRKCTQALHVRRRAAHGARAPYL